MTVRPTPSAANRRRAPPEQAQPGAEEEEGDREYREDGRVLRHELGPLGRHLVLGVLEGGELRRLRGADVEEGVGEERVAQRAELTAGLEVLGDGGAHGGGDVVGQRVRLDPAGVALVGDEGLPQRRAGPAILLLLEDVVEVLGLRLLAVGRELRAGLEGVLLSPVVGPVGLGTGVVEEVADDRGDQRGQDDGCPEEAGVGALGGRGGGRFDVAHRFQGAAPPAGAARRLLIAVLLAGARTPGMSSLRSLIRTPPRRG